MPKNKETKCVPFTGDSHFLKNCSSTTPTRTVPIESDGSEDLREVTDNSSRATKEETNAPLGGKRWKNFGNGKKCGHNFDGDVIKNIGGTEGNIIKGKVAAKNSGNAKGSIICDETNGSSNDEDNVEWDHFGNGEESRHNFGGKLVINCGGELVTDREDED